MPQPQQQSVKLVSGEEITVLTAVEKRWFINSRDTYLDQTKFTDVTDLRDLDLLLVQELSIFRLTQHLASGSDYEGFEIDEVLARRNIRELSEQITRLKNSMGLNKSTRDEANRGGDVNTFITNILDKAKIFGVHREKQLTKALVLFEELASIIGSYDRSDAEERGRLGFESENDILTWIREQMIPEYRKLDEHFRLNEQRYWVRNM